MMFDGPKQNPNEVKENQAEKQKHTPTRIRVQTVPMEGISKAKLITSTGLQRLVNKLFGSATPDYEGCKIQVVGNEVVCHIYLAEKTGNSTPSDGQFKALEGALAGAGAFQNKTAGAIAMHNRRNTSYRRYELTESAKEAFEEFVPKISKYTTYKNGKSSVNWGSAAKEEQEQATWGIQAPIFVSIPIDLNRVFGKVYGHKAEGDSVYFYMLTINRPLTSYREPNGNIIPTTWMFLITQMNDKAVAEAYSEIGGNPLQNTLGIYRG